MVLALTKLQTACGALTFGKVDAPLFIGIGLTVCHSERG
jgi:hypothetical protein